MLQKVFLRRLHRNTQSLCIKMEWKINTIFCVSTINILKLNVGICLFTYIQKSQSLCACLHMIHIWSAYVCVCFRVNTTWIRWEWKKLLVHFALPCPVLSYLCMTFKFVIFNAIWFHFFSHLISANHFSSQHFYVFGFHNWKTQNWKWIQIENTKNIECHRNMKTFLFCTTIESNVIYTSVHLIAFYRVRKIGILKKGGRINHFLWYGWISIILLVSFFLLRKRKWYNIK